jgi:beta-galactosidase
LRWDDVVYEPGELRVVAYKSGKQWATDSVKTAGAAEKIEMAPEGQLLPMTEKIFHS